MWTPGSLIELQVAAEQRHQHTVHGRIDRFGRTDLRRPRTDRRARRRR